MSKQEYTAESITALSARDAVRLRPAMYFGSTGSFGLHAIVFEVSSFLAYDFFEGNGSCLVISFHPDGSVTVKSDWTNISTGVFEGDGKNRTFLEIEVTQLGHLARNYFFPLGSVGLGAINFISEKFEIEIHRDGGAFKMAFERGLPLKPFHRMENSLDRKTQVWFKPDPEIFTETDFDFEKVIGRLRELACLLPGFSFILEDLRDGTERREVVNYKNGVADHVSWLTTGREVLLAKPFYKRIIEKDQSNKDKTVLEIAFQYVGGETGETIFSLANGKLTEQAGTHVAVLKSALLNSRHLRKDGGEGIAPNLVLRGLVAVVSAWIPGFGLHFKGPTYGELVTCFSENFVIQLHDAIELYFEEHPGAAKRLRSHFKN